MADILEIQDYLIVQPTTPENPVWTLSIKMNATQTTAVCNFEPKDTDGASITQSFLIGMETNGYVETMLCTNVSGTTLTVVRGIDLSGLDFDGTAALGVSHAGGDKMFINISAPYLNMVLQALRGQIGSVSKHSAIQTFINEATQNDRTFADVAARDSALTSPVNGMACLTIDTGLQYYNSGWNTLGVATPVTASLGCEKVGNDIRLDIAASNDLVKLTGNELDTNLTATKAQLDEAGTFFDATDITGAEAETLTDNSNAESLHTHMAFPGTQVLSGAVAATYQDLNLSAVSGSKVSFVCLKIKNISGLNTGVGVKTKGDADVFVFNSAGSQTTSSPSLAANEACYISLPTDSSGFVQIISSVAARTFQVNVEYFT